MHSTKNKRLTPVKTAWNIFSTIAGICSLASLSGDSISWKGFILEFVKAYQELVHPPFEGVFSWLPFAMPDPIFDYFFIGILIAGTYIKTLASKEEIEFSDKVLFPFAEIDHWTDIFYRIFGWPVTIIHYLVTLTKSFDENKERERWKEHFEERGQQEDIEKQVERMVRSAYADYMEPRMFFRWLGAIVLGFSALIIINITL